MNKNWKKYITRRLAVQVAQAWNFGWGEAMEKVYGVHVKDTLVFRDDKKTEYYVNASQHEKYVQDLYKLLENEMFLRLFHKEAKNELEKILSQTRKTLARDLTRLSNEELAKLYQSFVLPNVEKFYIRMWTVFNIGDPLANLVKAKLHEHTGDEARAEELLLIFSSPLKPNDAVKKRIDILKYSSKKDVNAGETIYSHIKKYRHIPMFDFDHEEYNLDHALEEIKHIKNPEQELKDIRQNFVRNKKLLKKHYQELKPTPELKNLLVFLQENVFLRDYRDMIRQKLNLLLREFYEEIGERLGLSVKQTALLTNKEIIFYLKQKQTFPESEIRKREKSFLLIQKNKQVEIYSGREAIKKAKQELGSIRYQNIEILKGRIGSRGRAVGRVKVVYTNQDLYKVEEGDVLVATMTRQDFVPAMRKAAALVTDEGNVVCHTAIIAREFNIPCIVGTGNATGVLQDGDRVEVDAIKGEVRKI